jgi:hypothetical protein
MAHKRKAEPSDPMQKVFEARRANLRTLAEKHEGIGKLAEKLGYANSSFLSQLIGPNPTRDVTEKNARKIEAALGLPALWMDTAV